MVDFTVFISRFKKSHPRCSMYGIFRFNLLLDLAHIDGTLRILTPQVSGYFAPEQTLPLEGPTGDS